MGSIDDFFTELTNQKQAKQEKLKNQPSSVPPTNNQSTLNSQQDTIDAYLSELETNKQEQSIPVITDDLLEEIQNNYQNKASDQSDCSNELLSNIENQFQQAKKNQQESTTANHNLQEIATAFQQKKQEDNKKNTLDNLEDIKQQELNKQRQEKLLRQQEELERKKQEQARKQREEQIKKQEQQLREKAQKWLKTIDPNSDEGFWFEQFSMSYDSKLKAAIEYLRALESSS